MYAATHTENVVQLLADGLALCDAGRYPDLIQRVSYDEDGDGRQDGIKLLMTKVDTAYASDSYASLCLIKITERDINGDPEDLSYIPFCTAINLNVLAYGEDCYGQIERDPVLKAIYNTVIPDREIMTTDEDGNSVGTGIYEFNRWIEFDAPQRS